ncbi:MAG: 50S ribosomal protein L22 [Candidatus Chisholmbacteria bacterium]|nr:50S ribosomal protein L22 [Candidatus Chisholmbacteria bacterium]
MLIKAEQKYIRMSPRKVRLVAQSLRGLPLNAALVALERMNKYAALPVRKTLSQAIANAVNNHGLKEDTLALKSIQVGEGATLKRWQPVSRGRAHSIFKRTSHIKIVLESTSNPKSQAPNPKQTQISKAQKTKQNV